MTRGYRRSWQRLPSGFRNILSNWTGLIFHSVVAFFLSPFIVHHLGNAAYGTWILIASLTGYLGLLDLGVRGAVTRYVARFYAQANHEDVNRIVPSALLIFLSAGALAVLVSIFLARLAVPAFNIPPEYRFDAGVVLVLMGLNVAASLIGGVFGGVLTALQRFELFNLIEILGTILRTLAIILALLAGRGLVALGLIQLTVSIATTLAYAWTDLRLYPELEIHLGKRDRRYLAMISSYSIYSFTLQVSTALIYYTESVVIGIFLPISAITFFAIASNLINYSRALVSGISTTMTPLASALEVRGHEPDLQRVLLRGASYSSLIVFPIAVTFLLRGESFVRLWMGPAYALLSSQVLFVLSFSSVFAAGNQTASATVLGVGRHRILVPVVLGEAACNLVLSIALVRRLGLIGVAWGTALPSLAVSLVLWPLCVRQIFRIPVFRYVVSTWARPALATLPFVAATYAVERFSGAGNLTQFIVQVAALLPLAFLGGWFWGIDSSERQELWERLIQPFLGVFRRT